MRVLCEVIVLRRNGMRLRPEEWPVAVAGELRILDDEARSNHFRRHLRVASLWVYVGSLQRPEIRLNSPELIRTVDGALLIRGLETVSYEGRIHEHEQMWLVGIPVVTRSRWVVAAVPDAAGTACAK